MQGCSEDVKYIDLLGRESYFLIFFFFLYSRPTYSHSCWSFPSTNALVPSHLSLSTRQAQEPSVGKLVPLHSPFSMTVAFKYINQIVLYHITEFANLFTPILISTALVQAAILSWMDTGNDSLSDLPTSTRVLSWDFPNAVWLDCVCSLFLSHLPSQTQGKARGRHDPGAP